MFAQLLRAVSLEVGFQSWRSDRRKVAANFRAYPGNGPAERYLYASDFIRGVVSAPDVAATRFLSRTFGVPFKGAR